MPFYYFNGVIGGFRCHFADSHKTVAVVVVVVAVLDCWVEVGRCCCLGKTARLGPRHGFPSTCRAAGFAGAAFLPPELAALVAAIVVAGLLLAVHSAHPAYVEAVLGCP